MILLIVTAFLGIANFAMHKAVLESGHALMEQMRWMRAGGSLSISLVMEFALLVGALLAIDHGWAGTAFAYGAYTALNAISAWLILSNRV